MEIETNINNVHSTLDLLSEHPIILYVIIPSLSITVMSTTFAYIISSTLFKSNGKYLSKDGTIILENILALIFSLIIVSFYFFIQQIPIKYVFYDFLFQTVLSSFFLRIELYRSITHSVKHWIINKLEIKNKGN